jgi:hypothetical protein
VGINASRMRGRVGSRAAGTGVTARIRAAGTSPLSDRRAIALLTAAGLVAAALLLRNYRDLLFFYDEWDFIQGRRDWDPDTFLRAHNEHLVLVSTVVYKLLFVTAGITSYWPYAIFLTLTHLAAAGMLFAVIRAWSGNELALLAATVMLFLGTGWEVMLWPFEMGVTISLAAALGAVLCIERRTPRGDAWACVLMVLSVSAASLGLPFLVGLGIMILGASGPGRLWVVGVPGALWGAWFLAYGNSTSKVENIPQIPTYVVDSEPSWVSPPRSADRSPWRPPSRSSQVSSSGASTATVPPPSWPRQE